MRSEGHRPESGAMAFSRMGHGLAHSPHKLLRYSSLVATQGLRIIGWSNTYNRETSMTIQSINARNQFKGKIREIIEGPVVSEIDVDTPFGIVTSVITTRSVKELQLKVGVEVLALVKATEVSIAKL